MDASGTTAAHPAKVVLAEDSTSPAMAAHVAKTVASPAAAGAAGDSTDGVPLEQPAADDDAEEGNDTVCSLSGVPTDSGGTVPADAAAAAAAAAAGEKMLQGADEEDAKRMGGDTTRTLSRVPTDPLWRPPVGAHRSDATAACQESKSVEDCAVVPRSTHGSSIPTPDSLTPYYGKPNEARSLQHLSPSLRLTSPTTLPPPPPPPPPPLPMPRLPAGRRLRLYTSNRTGKWVTREMAALDFLTGVRMKNEAFIRAQGTRGISGGGRDTGEHADEQLRLASTGLSSETQHTGGRSFKNSRDPVMSLSSTTPGEPSSDGGGATTTSRKSNSRTPPTAGHPLDVTATPAVSINAPAPADDDSDSSEGGWLDQPLPSSSNNNNNNNNNNDTASVGLPGNATWRGAVAGRGSGINAPVGVAAGAGAGGRGMSGAASPAPARRLRGREVAHVRVPTTLRHRMQRLPGHGAAVVRQWEQGLTKQERLLEGRMFFSCSKGYPLMVSSVLHYQPEEEEARRARQKWIDERGAEAFQIPQRDWRGYSYAHLLRPLQHRRSGASSGGIGTNGNLAATTAAAAAAELGMGGAGTTVSGTVGGISGPSGTGVSGGGTTAILDCSDGEGGGVSGGDGSCGRDADGPDTLQYRAGFLDDPALTLGKHRHMTRGDQNTGPVVSSVLLFVKPRVLKDELNARFRENHPNLPPSLTLSKIRTVKRQALLGCHRAGMEVATVALACVYFERLCLAGVVTKPNRRLTMAACLAIAYKFNEPVLVGGVSKLPALWAFVDQEWTVGKKRVLEAEFGVLVQLSFDLHEDPRDVFHHFVLLLKMIESNASLYLGEEMMTQHQEALETYFRDFVHSDTSNADKGGGDGTGGESPRAKAASDSAAMGADSRPRVSSSQGSPPWMEMPGWLNRRPTSATSRWLAGWRGSQEVDSADARVLASGPARNAGEVGIRAADSQQSGKAAAVGPGEKLRLAGQELGKGTRQLRHKLNKNVRDGASLLAGGVSTRRRSGRRKMET